MTTAPALNQYIDMAETDIASVAPAAGGAPQQSPLQKFIETRIILNIHFQILVNAMTAYALFGDDVRILITAPVSQSIADSVFLAFSLFAFVLFNAELLLQSYAVAGYFPWPRHEGKSRWEQLRSGDWPLGSFYFWLDLIATYSLIFELSRLVEVWGGDDPMLAGPVEVDLGFVDIMYGVDGGARQSNDDGGGVDASAARSARAGRASRAGAKAGRIVRIVRMVRLIRIVKVAKTYETLQDSGSTGHPSAAANGVARRSSVSRATNKVTPDSPDLFDEILPESHVGRSMSELTQRRVIVGVLVILLTLPMLEYPATNEEAFYASRLAHSFLYKSDLCNASAVTNGEAAPAYGQFGCGYLDRGLVSANGMVVHVGQQSTNRLLAMKHEVQAWDDDACPGLDDCTYSSQTTVVYDPNNALGNVAESCHVRQSAHDEFIIKSTNQDTGRRYMTVTHWDTTDFKSDVAVMSLLLTCFVIVLLGAGTMTFNADTQRLVIAPIENMMKRVNEISNDPLSVGSGIRLDASQEGLETTFLLQTIDKIGNLMRIGFGEAGAQIIATNLRDSNDDALDIRNILSGRGIVSIFGFCDIRNFTDTTECLQEEVMTFVNRVAHILHNTVKDCKGAANKNIGDAFLLSWKVPSEMCDARSGAIKAGADCSDLFDNALYAFLKFTALLRRHDKFVTSFSSEANRKLFQRMPDYRCAVGMGLHVGVAVEGAIGTVQKIDATYVSLHVNNAEFLESSTKVYKVPLLMSHYFRDQLSPEAKAWCRRIDTVRVSDALTFELWTYDIDYDADFNPQNEEDSRPTTGVGSGNLAASSSLLSAEEKRRMRRVTIALEELDPDKKPWQILGDPRLAKQEPKVAPAPPITTFDPEDGGHQDGVEPVGHYHPRLWAKDPDLCLLRHKMDHPGLREAWRASEELYHSGAWGACVASLEAFQVAFAAANGGAQRDGPADFLLQFIRSHADEATGEIADDPKHATLKRVPHD